MNEKEFKDLLLRAGYKKINDLDDIYESEHYLIHVYKSHYGIREKEGNKYNSFPTLPYDELMFANDLLRIEHSDDLLMVKKQEEATKPILNLNEPPQGRPLFILWEQIAEPPFIAFCKDEQEALKYLESDAIEFDEQEAVNYTLEELKDIEFDEDIILEKGSTTIRIMRPSSYSLCQIEAMK